MANRLADQQEAVFFDCGVSWVYPASRSGTVTDPAY